jgi:hypothetical protein
VCDVVYVLFLKEEGHARNSVTEYVNVHNEICLCFIVIKTVIGLIVVSRDGQAKTNIFLGGEPSAHCKQGFAKYSYLYSFHKHRI